jgi:hypothetical protein
MRRRVGQGLSGAERGSHDGLYGDPPAPDRDRSTTGADIDQTSDRDADSSWRAGDRRV